MSGIDLDRLCQAIEEYEACEPFVTVENDRLETLPTAFANGTYLWKDVEWIVRWACRRTLDGHIHPAETAFRTNSMARIERAIEAALSATSPRERIEAVSSLDGVDVPIASAVLQFVDPERFVAVDVQSWSALHAHGELDEAFPDPVSAVDYERYLARCDALGAAADVRTVDVGRGLWRLGTRDASDA